MDIKEKKYMRRNLLLPISATHKEREIKNISLKSKRNNSNNSNNSFVLSNDSSVNTESKNKKRNLSYKRIIFNPLKNATTKNDNGKKVFDNEFLANVHTGFLEKKKLKSISSIQSLFEVKRNYSISPRKNILNNKVRSLSSDYDKKQNSEYKHNPENLSHNNGQLSFVDLLLKYKMNNRFVLKRAYPNLRKIDISSNKKYLQKFKESINEMIKNIGNNGRQIFLNEVHFVHQCLFNTNIHIKTPLENKSTNEIITQNKKPNYEFIDFLGKQNKYITRLSVDLDDKNSNDWNIKNNKDSPLISDNSSEKKTNKKKVGMFKSNRNRRKNFLKPIKLTKVNTQKIGKNNSVKKVKKNIILEISKKGYQKMKDKKHRSFARLIDNTLEKHKNVIKKLDNIIEADKLLFQKENANISQ